MPPGCPSDDTLIAHVHHELPALDAKRISRHLDECVTCRELMVAVVRAVPIGTPSLFANAPTIPNDVPESEPYEPLAPGALIGRYRVDELLGVGGMGKVYAAYDHELDRSIALKVMRPELAPIASELTERLRRESQLMAKVVDPAVIAVYDIGRIDDAVFVAMERISGETARSYLARVKRPWHVVLDLYMRAGSGLAAAHRAGVIHRDFKPDNVLVELEGETAKRVIVTDFGVARLVQESDGLRRSHPHLEPVDLTATGAAIGTPAYMAPEQLAGEPVDARADVFSFAATVWEGLFGVRPFPGKTVEEIRASMEAPAIVASDRSAPRWLVRVLLRGLAIDPVVRWPDMPSLLAALDRHRRRGRRSKVLQAVAVVGVLATFAGFAFERSQVPDACAIARRNFDEVWNPAREASVRVALAGDPKALASLAKDATAWRSTAGACSTDRPATIACLDARRVELAGFVDDVVASGSAAARRAHALTSTLGDPALCATPPPGVLQPSVPVDPAARRAVTDVRIRLADVMAERDRGELVAALRDAKALAVGPLPPWDPIHAEVLYELGAVELQTSDLASSIRTLREAESIAIGSHSHDDATAARVWTELARATLQTEDGTHALEYTTLADAALDRVGRPPELDAAFLEAHASALLAADRIHDAEVTVGRAIELARTRTPDLMAQALSGQARIDEKQGKYTEAVEIYRRALAALAAREPSVRFEIELRGALAVNLVRIGQSEQGMQEARRAVTLADAKLDAHNPQRAIARSDLSMTEEFAGKFDSALADAREADAMIVANGGERTTMWVRVADMEGRQLIFMSRYAEANAKLTRACDVSEFLEQSNSTWLASCWADLAQARDLVRKHADALDLITRALAIDEPKLGSGHPDVAQLYETRGEIQFNLGHRAEAIADLERACAALAKSIGGPLTIEPGSLGSCEWALGQIVWSDDRARGRTLIESAVEHMHGQRAYADDLTSATAWLKRHGQR